MEQFITLHIPPCGQWRWRLVEIHVKDGKAIGWVDNGKLIENIGVLTNEDTVVEGHKP